MNVDGSMPRPGVYLGGGGGGGQQMMPDGKSSNVPSPEMLAQWHHQQKNVNFQQDNTASFLGESTSGGGGQGRCGGADGGSSDDDIKPNVGALQNGGQASMPPGASGIDGCPPEGFNPHGAGGPSMPGFMQDPNMTQTDLLHGKVPNENLTPEQLLQRNEKMESIRKMKEMLFPEQQQQLFSEQHLQQQQQQGGQQRLGTSPQDDMPSDTMMRIQGDAMRGRGVPPDMWNGPGPPGQQFKYPNMAGSPLAELAYSPPGFGMNGGDEGSFDGGPFGPGPGAFGGGPMEGMTRQQWESMPPGQREWFKLQQDHFIEKCHKQMMVGGGGGGPPGPNHQGGFNQMQRRMGPGGPLSPISPSFMGPGGPMQSPHMMPSDFGGQCFPPGHPMFGADSSFNGGREGMPPEGLMQFNERQMMMMPGGGGGGMMGPGGGGGLQQFGPDFNQHMMGHRHGADVGPPHMGGGMVQKMPLGYGLKRKRSAVSMNADEEMYKRLLPAPSPQQFSYVDPLEGQELVITKQV